MDEVTQQNAALVEQASAAAESLEEQADMLAETMTHFRLDGTTGYSAPRRTASKPAHKPVVQLMPSPATPKIGKPSKPIDDDEWTEF
jgi:methyl-accepting chemotaxis protein